MRGHIERTTTYQSRNADKGKEWCAHFFYDKTRLNMTFFGATEEEAVSKANAFWEKDRIEREAKWAKREEAKAARKSKAVAQ